MKNIKNIAIFAALLTVFAACERNMNVPMGDPRIVSESSSVTENMLQVAGQYSTVTSIGQICMKIGTDQSLASAIEETLKMDNTLFSGTVSGLKANTTYYYQYV